MSQLSFKRCKKSRSDFILAVLVAAIFATRFDTSIAVNADETTAKSETNKTTQSTRQDVLQLVNQLDAEQRSVRIKAERSLLSLGPSVLPWLPAPELLESAQTRETVRRIRLELERRKALEAIKPTRATLMGRMSLDAAAESISKQTGNLIDLTDVPADKRSRVVLFNAQDVTFWQAIDLVCQLSQCHIVNQNTGEANPNSDIHRPAVKLGVLDERPANNPHIESEQAVRTSITTASVRELFGDDQHDKLRVGFEFHVEPRLRPLFLKYRGRDISASLGPEKEKRPLASMASVDDSLELPLGQNGRRIAIHADFRLPRSASAGDADFAINASGKLVMQCAAATERLVVSAVTRSKGVVRRRGGVSLLIRKIDVEEVGERTNLDVQCVVTYDTGGPAFESHRTWLFHNRVYMESKQTAEGLPVSRQSPASFEIDGQANGGVMVTYRFTNLATKMLEGAFVYHAPTLIVDVPVTFRLSEIRVSKDAR